MADIKISELEPTTDLEGLYTIGSDKNNLSKKVSLQFLKDAANYANEQGDYAKQAGDTVNGNVGVSDYPEFSASKSYVIGDIVRYNGVLYAFTANHAASAWNGSDVKATSINAITSGKLTELESNLLIESGQKEITDLIKSIYVHSTNEQSIEDVEFVLRYVSYNTYLKDSLGVQLWAIKGDSSETILNTLKFPQWKKNERLSVNVKFSLEEVQYEVLITIITSDKVFEEYPNTQVKAVIAESGKKDTTTFPAVLSNIKKLQNEDNDIKATIDVNTKLIDIVTRDVSGQRRIFSFADAYAHNIRLENDIFQVNDKVVVDVTKNTSENPCIIYGYIGEDYTALVNKSGGFVGTIELNLAKSFDYLAIVVVGGIIDCNVLWNRIEKDSLVSKLSEVTKIPREIVIGENLLNDGGDVGYTIVSGGAFAIVDVAPTNWILKKWINVHGANSITFGIDGKKGEGDIYNYAFYDSNKKLIGSVVSTFKTFIETIEVPADAYYLCATYPNNFKSVLHQINAGNEILPYSPYVPEFWYTDKDEYGVEWKFNAYKKKSDIELFTPKKIYTICNDVSQNESIAGQRNYAVGLYLDHLVKLDSYENIRFETTQRDVFPVFSHFDSYTNGAGWTWNEDGSILKETEKYVKLFGEKIYPAFNFTHCSVLNSATEDKFPKILCIGDSVTEGYLANTNKDNNNFPNAYWQWIKMFFEFDKKQNGGGYESLLLGKRNVVNQKGEYIDGSVISFRACAEGKGGASLSEYLRSNKVGGAENHFYDADIVDDNKFSILYWLKQYRTMDDNGVRLQGVAGQDVVGSDGKTYKIGEQVTDVNAWDVCTPTHIIIQLGYNDGDRAGYLEDMVAMADIIQSQIPSCIVGFSLPDCPGTYFPEFYPQYGNDSAERYPNSYYLNPAKSSHKTFMSMNKKLMTLDDADNNRYYIPSYFISPTADSAPCRKNNFASWLGSADDYHGFNVQGYSAPNLHPNNHAHAAWGYEMYAWIKYTLLNL